MQPNQIQQALTGVGLSRVSAQLAQLAQPAIRLTTTPTNEASIPVGASKFGGAPDLPAGTAWPQYKNLPMSFLAQARLSEVAPHDVAHALPTQGWLWFFYDAQQQTYGADPGDKGGWKIIFQSNPQTALQRVTIPANLPKSAQFTPCAVTYAAIMTLPEDPHADAPALQLTPAEQQQYDQLWSQWPSQADRAAPQNQLLGHPDTLQDDMRLQCQLAFHGVASGNDDKAAQLSTGAQNWRLLFQVDSDPHAGMHWGDGGILYYWLQGADLAAQRFEQSWLVMQTT